MRRKREFNKEWQNAKDQCLSSSPFSVQTLSSQSTIPLNKRRVRNAYLQQESISNSYHEPQLVRSKRAAIRATSSRLVNASTPTLDLSSWNHAVGCRDNPSSPAREGFSPSAKVYETLAPGERSPANLPMGPAREKGRAGQSPLLPPPQLRGESLLRLTLRIDEPGILG